MALKEKLGKRKPATFCFFKGILEGRCERTAEVIYLDGQLMVINVFVQIKKCIYLNCKMYLTHFECRCKSTAEVMSLDGRLMVRAGFNGPSTLLAD